MYFFLEDVRVNELVKKSVFVMGSSGLITIVTVSYSEPSESSPHFTSRFSDTAMPKY
jgi:hypothetical protein